MRSGKGCFRSRKWIFDDNRMEMERGGEVWDCKPTTAEIFCEKLD